MSRRVLIVDDDPDIRRIGALCLERVAGWEVVQAASGSECLERMDPDFDVILLDVMMPGMDGPTTLDALGRRASTREVPVIFMTARVQLDEVEEYLEMGAQGVIAKPFDPMGLAAEVDSILTR